MSSQVKPLRVIKPVPSTVFATTHVHTHGVLMTGSGQQVDVLFWFSWPHPHIRIKLVVEPNVP